jgi:hypothetical protein
MSADPDPHQPAHFQSSQESRAPFSPVPYFPRPFELSPQSIWIDSTPESIHWESRERAAQYQALILIKDLFSNIYNIPFLEYPWSDTRYPSMVKIWGIDSLDEDSAFYLDQVWLHRWHPDRPQEWAVFATTTEEKPLSQIMSNDGVWLEEGTRAYLDEMLAQMLLSSDKGTRQLSMILSDALQTHQLRYRHLHSVYHHWTGELQIEALYEFPIYPAKSKLWL